MSLTKFTSLKTALNLLSLIREGMLTSLWSIKVFTSNSMISAPPHEYHLDKPTLQASDVKDVPAEFVADPFIIVHENKYYMFFEVLNKASGRGEIGLAISNDGEEWMYEKIVMNEKHHLSYPQVFKFKDEIYMLPETEQTQGVLLYKATNFPFEWEIACKLFSGRYVDPSIFEFDNKWWIFAGSEGKNLHLFHSDSLEGPWVEHPQSPIITNNSSISRPGGRIIVQNGEIYRYTQDGKDYYGKATRVFKIIKLTDSEYEEEEAELILSGTNRDNDWRRDGMHHIDQVKIQDGQWLVAVDGHRFRKINYFFWKLDRMFSKIQLKIREALSL
ncbi:glucosamine inositolphosphorylceramide transferase family protein [Paenibacillus cremeus]|uniref:Family 43 glycosylhydrolase n=1 Tax=Paenibacillus cremeus TaxID=2163881 RepID=A0A559K0G8_9BACL|nr:family 43 glycosylhydrolase [Paenibacillus cremeus]TVY05649.1 family 43 glycosylhydrolase [Paenibacillus cremeus]